MSVTKEKIYAVADKVTNSKPYKALEATAVTAGATLASIGTMAMTTFATEGETISNAIATEINEGSILENAQPFIVPAISIMCIIGGIKLGMRFLRGSMH